jgi:glycosyltransferase involved in cell wall biosynthesis
MVKICLNMIVKNESKTIKRLLESVISIIDYYVICDTGSTDDTIKIVIDFTHSLISFN